MSGGPAVKRMPCPNLNFSASPNPGANTLQAGFSSRGAIKPTDFGMAKFGEYGFGPEAELMIEVDGLRPAS